MVCPKCGNDDRSMLSKIVTGKKVVIFCESCGADFPEDLKKEG